VDEHGDAEQHAGHDERCESQQLAAVDVAPVPEPEQQPAQRSKMSIIGTAKRIGKKCARRGTATIVDPKPVRPKTV
jgi:hypothetical protein